MSRFSVKWARKSFSTWLAAKRALRVLVISLATLLLALAGSEALAQISFVAEAVAVDHLLKGVVGIIAVLGVDAVGKPFLC